MRPPRPGSFGDKMIKGAAGATAGMASGTMLTTVGASGIGGAITTASAGAVGTAATALSGVAASASSFGVVGSAVGSVASFGATAITTVASGAAAVGTAVGTVAVEHLLPFLLPLGTAFIALSNGLTNNNLKTILLCGGL